jgi:hypothetical protein
MVVVQVMGAAAILAREWELKMAVPVVVQRD